MIGRTTPLQRYRSPISLHKDVLVGLIPHSLDKNIQTTSLQQHQASKYQCFRYEMHMEDGRIVTKMSQSNKGSCEGLWSAVEGDRTYTLKKGLTFQMNSILFIFVIIIMSLIFFITAVYMGLAYMMRTMKDFQILFS